MGVGRHPITEGVKYEGQLENGQGHGKGKMTWPDGKVYEGDFVGGKIQGNGTMHSADKKWSYYGGFLDGAFHGYGIHDC